MRYLSTDLETTGLDPDQDQILQIAAVVDDTLWMKDVPVDELPYIDLRIKHERVSGDPFALHMNAALLLQIANCERTCRLDTAETDLRDFFWKNYGTGKIVAAGKNFASFDRQFIRRAMPRIEKLFHHRSIDPAMLYYQPEDETPPNTETCLTRAGFSNVVKHDALEDARQVVRLVRAALGRGQCVA